MSADLAPLVSGATAFDPKHTAWPSQLACFFEGLLSPTGCRHEDYLLQNGQGAFEGLHSNWVTESMLACARPSDKMLEEGLGQRFKKAGITAVINVEEVGEHPFCGPGIVESGFSYTPERFVEQGVAVHHVPWEDLGCPPFSKMLSIVQLIKETVDQGGKVAVHCHAGLGRTGLVIACFLVYAQNMAPNEAVALVRSKRPGSVQTIRQAQYVSDFFRYVTSERTGDTIPLLEKADWEAYHKESALFQFWHSAALCCWDAVVFVSTLCCPPRGSPKVSPRVREEE